MKIRYKNKGRFTFNRITIGQCEFELNWSRSFGAGVDYQIDDNLRTTIHAIWPSLIITLPRIIFKSKSECFEVAFSKLGAGFMFNKADCGAFIFVTIGFIRLFWFIKS